MARVGKPLGAMQVLLPRGEIRIYRSGGHFLHLDDPVSFAADEIGFLRAGS